MKLAADPLPRTFVYSKAFFAGLVFTASLPVWPFLIALLWGLSGGYLPPLPKLLSELIVPLFPFVLFWWGFVGWGVFTASPIDVSARGIDCGWFARPSKTIFWSSKPKITKEAIDNEGRVETIEVDDGQQKIRITDSLKDYEDFKELLNALAAVHDLPITTIDAMGWKRIVHDGPSARL